MSLLKINQHETDVSEAKLKKADGFEWKKKGKLEAVLAVKEQMYHMHMYPHAEVSLVTTTVVFEQMRKTEEPIRTI